MHYAKGFVLYVPYVWVSLFGFAYRFPVLDF